MCALEVSIGSIFNFLLLAQATRLPFGELRSEIERATAINGALYNLCAVSFALWLVE